MNPKITIAEAADIANVSIQAIHKKLKNSDLNYFKSQNKIYFHHDTSKKIINLNPTPKIFTWQNLKGGVGKTSLCFSTACKLASYGLNVLVVDIDQQGNFTQSCGFDAENSPIMIDIIKNDLAINDCLTKIFDGLWLLPSRIENALLDNLFAINGLPVDREFKKRINNLKGKYDIIFIDCPPSLGSSVCSAALCADYIIIPLDPEKFSISGLNITMDEIEKNIFKKYETKINIKILLNKFDSRTTLSSNTLSTLLSSQKTKDKLFNVFIRINQEFPNSIAQGKTLFDSLKTSTAREDIELLSKEIIALCIE